MSKKLTLLFGFLGLYLISAGISLAAFTYLKKAPEVKVPVTQNNIGSTRGRIDTSLPKTQACPINGEKYTQQEKDIWDSRRPLATMIENHQDSRPPSGLSKADVVYEAVAEGGITRFLGIFYCGVAFEDVKLAPVRSARIYFINWASEYGDKPIFMHVGGANNYSGSGDTARDVKALETLETIGWRVPQGNDFDTTYDSGFPIFWRNYERLDHAVATEHTMMASTDEAFKQADKRGFAGKDKNGVPWDKTFVPWTFQDGTASSSPQTLSVSFDFWSSMPGYNVEWKYDSKNNNYLRFDGGAAHTDIEFGNVQLSASNVVVMKVIERGPVDKNKHMFYTNIGRGEALIFQNGKVIKGSWQKDTRQARTKFLDENKKEVTFVRGPIWIEAIPSQNQVTY